MPTDIELRLIAPNAEAIKSIRQVATESEKLYKNNEKNQKREKGLIEDIEDAMDELHKKRKQAFTITEIEKYNKKLAEAKQHLEEYNKAGATVEKQTDSLIQKFGKWAVGIGLITTVLNGLKKTFADTVFGMNAITRAGELWAQMTYNIVTANNALNTSLISSLAIGRQINDLRKRERLDMVDMAKNQKTFNELYFAASDRRRTDADRIHLLDQALIAHNLVIDKEIENLQEQKSIVVQQLINRPKSNKLLDQEAKLNVLILQAEGRRWSETKRIEALRTGMLEEARNKEIADQEKIDNEALKKQKDANDKLLKDQEEYYLEKRDMFFNFIGEIEKANEEAIERERKQQERQWTFDKSIADKLTDQQTKAAKIKWDLILEEERIAKEEADDLQRARLEALKEGLNELLEFTQTITDRELEDAQRHREILDTRISETQSAIETELRLTEAGFASNLDAKKKELADLKKQRDKALKDEEAALQKQRVMESIAQGVNIFSSATNILKSSTKLGPLGVILAAGAIAAMFTLLGSVKKRSSEIRLAEGGHGEVKGRLHSEGGERFLDHVEIEAGEKWGVLSRPASRKYGKAFYEMVDSFNRNKLPIPKAGIMITNINNDGPNKRLDEVNSNLRRISSKEEITVIGSTTIYKKGSNTRVIKRR